ncbi:hypothetical protein [Nocardioides sp. KR10-350]|uniref:hypothetical protein n=1 Tax=Nocardioides cheoyonin TaxID=3156615 RepID=UPI0032B5DFF2
MGTTVLQEALQQKHDELNERLNAARSTIDRREAHREAFGRQISQRGCPPIDLFLSGTSKHLHAVDQVVLPSVRVNCKYGGYLVHDYLRPARELEVVLAHVKAHEYGSTYETSFDWAKVWGDVERAFAGQWGQERKLADRLGKELPDELLEKITADLRAAEERAPTRPHPYLPHTGHAGSFTRRIMRVADSFWDAVEGRFVPEQRHKEHKRPGLIGQYLMADPRFDEETEAEAGAEEGEAAPR